MSLIIEQDIERLSVASELCPLEIAPAVAYGAQLAWLSVLHHLDRLWERSLVVDEELYEDIILCYGLLHVLIGPYGGLHLAAVDTSESSEVNHDRFPRSLRGSHSSLVVLILRLYRLCTGEVEVLCVHWRCESRYRLAGSSPQSRHHVYGEGERAPCEEETCHRSACVDDFLAHLVPFVLVVRESYPSDEVSAEEGEEHYPQREECLTVKYMPAVGEVSHTEELQRECQLDESEGHLDVVHPVARLRCGLEPCREYGEECERKGEGYGEAEHADGGAYDIP